MGKLKTKYPIQISIQFFLFLENSQLMRDIYTVQLQNRPLLYSHVYQQFQQFLINNKISYESYMFFQALNAEQEEIMDQQWSIDINQIEERGRYIMIRVKSHTQHIKELFYEQMGLLGSRLESIEQKLGSMQTKEANEVKIAMGSPLMHQTSSLGAAILPDKDLDIGILFSEPIFDEKKHKQANLPVDFRSEIQRLYSALNNSYKPEITVECEIGTKEHLKHLIGIKKPKILHIICHGSKDGELQFEDDSKFALGALCTIDSNKIKQILLSEVESIPSLVFINSCYSQLIGKIFYEVGAKYVIMIDSQDKIDDEAAQIFSQNFYRNIFRGQKVDFSFKQAKDSVGIKHNSFGCCCCRHTSAQKHREGCRWLILAEEMGEQQAHKIYHIPSEKCVCQLRNLNRHKLTCEWAQFSLFHINNDFRIPGQDGEEHFPKKKSELPDYLPYKKKDLVICCCFSFEGDCKQAKIPHSECYKFKMLPTGVSNSEPLYQLQKNVNFRTQIIDYSAPELMEYHEKVQNCCVMGRQQELYQFMKKIKDPQISTFILYGLSGVGKTTFSIKTATYLIERRIYEIYFFIDLYDINDKEMFRHKFNEVTKFGYPNNRENLNQVRNKPMLIILDNADNFFISSILDFQEQLQNLRKQIYYTKFIITCNEKNYSVLQNAKLITNSCFVKQMKVLDENVAARVLFTKIRNYLDISIDYMDIRGLITHKKELQIPKIIQNFSHSFSALKPKIKLLDLSRKIEDLGAGDYAFNKLVEENLKILKDKSKQSYQMLIFISQFSQGIDKKDFNILSLFDGTQNSREGRNREYLQNLIDTPVDKNWKQRLAILFQQNEQPTLKTTLSIQSTSSDSHSYDTIPQFLRVGKNAKQEKPMEEDDLLLKGESYFLEQIGINKFIVKRFIRDFIWNKDKSDDNFYMKHIFVVYTALILDIYLEFLVEEKYVHEDILQYTQISHAGIFRYQDNNYNQTKLLQYNNEYNTKFQMILKEQPSLKQKIKCSDPSVFILNHKLDFLHVYTYDWTKVYQYLNLNRKRQAPILMNYLEKLIILIPTVIKIANFEDSLLQYSIRQSIQLLAQIRKFLRPNHSFLLTLKLKLMKAGYDVQRGDEDIPKPQYQFDINKNDLEQISGQTLKNINAEFRFEVALLEMYKQYKKSKDIKKFLQPSIKMGADRLVEMMKRLQKRINEQEEWTANKVCLILNAKRYLILAMTYYKILDASIKYISNLTILNLKKLMTPIFIRFAESACETFFVNGMMKLGLRAKLIGVSISWQIGKNRAKPTQFNKQLQTERQKLTECENIFEDKKNNLIGFTNFDVLIKRIKKQMKAKMWQESVNSFIFMKAVPLSSKKNVILKNLIRKKQQQRQYIKNMFLDEKIDISLKFKILTCEKLEEQSKKGCTILVLNTNIKIDNNRAFLVLEGDDLKERYLQISSELILEYPILNSKLLILMGNNANQGIKRLALLSKNAPTMVSITSSQDGEFNDFEEASYQNLGSSSLRDLQKIIENNNRIAISQIQVAKYLIKSLINSKNTHEKIQTILHQLQITFKQQLKHIDIDIIQNKDIIIQMVNGTYKDLSPGYRKAHNIDTQLINSPHVIYRKWKQINSVFRELNNQKRPKHINICGGNGVGKTTFLEQIGRMLIERDHFQNGVYIIRGKQVQQKYQSDFEAYIIKNSEKGNIFSMQSFSKYGNQQFMLMIDDFHLIKPRSNGRYNIFLNRLIQMQINLILVTHESFNIRDTFPDIKTIKIQKIKQFQLNLYAYNVLDLNNPAVVQEYEDENKKKKINFQDIIRISEKYRNSLSLMPLSQEQPFKKMFSNRY